MASCPWPGQSSDSINLAYGSNVYSMEIQSAYAGSSCLQDQSPELFLWEVFDTYLPSHINKNGTQISNDAPEIQDYSS